jgi:hypothetical protein
MQIIYVATFQLGHIKMPDNESILLSILDISGSEPLIKSSQYVRTTRNIRQDSSKDQICRIGAENSCARSQPEAGGNRVAACDENATQG